MNLKMVYQEGTRRGLVVTAVLALGVCTLALCLRGARWERFHPDEHAIARWLAFTQKHPYITERVYPGGYFELMRPVRKLEERAAYFHQRWETWLTPGRARTTVRKEHDFIYRGRIWNAWLMALASMLMYGLAVRLLNCRLAALLAAAWYGLHPFVIEHGHYAETDAVMMATQVLTLWLLAVAMQEKRIWVALTAALTAGVAFGCKYTLLPLLALPPAGAWILAGRSGWKVGARAGLTLAALVLCGAGFVWATPAIYENYAFFVSGSRHVAQRTYGEMAGLLGEMANVPGAGRLLKTRVFLDEAAKFGLLAWGLILTSIPLWFTRRMRSVWCTLPLFGLLFVVYVVVGLPWLRNQEFLPLLPVLAVTIVLPVATLLRGGARPEGEGPRLGRLRLVLVAQVAILALVLVQNAASGVRMASAFGQHDSRTRLRDWLATCGPADARIGYEPYAEPVAEHWNTQAFCTPKVERMPPEVFDDREQAYQVCAPSMSGRGLRHPWTGQRYATGASNYTAFTNRAVLLRRETITRGIRPMFSQVDVELWGLHGRRPEVGRLDVAIVLNRPAKLRMGEERLYAPAREVGAGPQTGLLLSRRRGQMAFIQPSDQPAQVVALHTGPGATTAVRWNRLLQPREALLAPATAQNFKVDRTAARLARRAVLPTAKVRLSTHDPSVRCVALPVTSAADAVRLMRVGGSSDKALHFLAELARTRALTDAEQVELVLALGDRPIGQITGAASLPSRQTLDRCLRTARKTWEQLDKVMSLADDDDRLAVSVNGVEDRLLDDFARLRLDQQPMERLTHADQPDDLELRGFEIPCLLLPGRYKLDARFDCRRSPAEPASDTPLDLTTPVLSLTGCLVEPLNTVWTEDGLHLHFQCVVRVSRPVIPELMITQAPGSAAVHVMTQAELTWSTRDRLQENHAMLTVALGRLTGE